MQKNPNKKIIILSIFLIIFLLFIFFLTRNINTYTSPPDIPEGSITQNILEKSTATLKLNDQTFETDIKENESVYTFMQSLHDKQIIQFEEKTYTGLGKLITEINGVKNKDGKYWIYYVNGIEATVGVSNYKLKNHDIVSWKYENDKNK